MRETRRCFEHMVTVNKGNLASFLAWKLRQANQRPPSRKNARFSMRGCFLSLLHLSLLIGAGRVWPKVKRAEIKHAIFKSSTKKTPGPEKLSFRVLREAYTAVPELFDYLYPVLLANGYHPKCFKEATGVILKKPQNAKPPYRNYALPKAYRVISLLNCLGKVAEKIVARRLAVMAECKTLLQKYQIGGRRQKSAIDAVMILIQKVQINWRTRKKKRGWVTSALFVDVKNAFPSVGITQFAEICIHLKLPTELIQWFISFMSDRAMRFAFDGEVGPMIEVNSGIPQGSPVSPIMFPIFLQHILKKLDQWRDVEIISYVDDIAIVAESSCARINGIRIQLAMQRLIRAADEAHCKRGL